MFRGLIKWPLLTLMNQKGLNKRHKPLVIVELMWDNITNKPIIAERATEEDWSGLVDPDEVTTKVVPVKPD